MARQARERCESGVYHVVTRGINLDLKYFVIWFMVSIYPLIVIPNNFYRFSPLGIIPPDYFYGPRYIVLTIISMISLFTLRKHRISINQVSIS